MQSLVGKQSELWAIIEKFENKFEDSSRMYSVNVFASLLPLNLDVVIIQLGS